jgi:hypothetical protein
MSRSDIVLDVQGDLIDLFFDNQNASTPSFYSAYEHALLLAEVSRYLVTSFHTSYHCTNWLRLFPPYQDSILMVKLLDLLPSTS